MDTVRTSPSPKKLTLGKNRQSKSPEHEHQAKKSKINTLFTPKKSPQSQQQSPESDESPILVVKPVPQKPQSPQKDNLIPELNPDDDEEQEKIRQSIDESYTFDPIKNFYYRPTCIKKLRDVLAALRWRTTYGLHYGLCEFWALINAARESKPPAPIPFESAVDLRDAVAKYIQKQPRKIFEAAQKNYPKIMKGVIYEQWLDTANQHLAAGSSSDYVRCAIAWFLKRDIKLARQMKGTIELIKGQDADVQPEPLSGSEICIITGDPYPCYRYKADTCKFEVICEAPGHTSAIVPLNKAQITMRWLVSELENLNRKAKFFDVITDLHFLLYVILIGPGILFSISTADKNVCECIVEPLEKLGKFIDVKTKVILEEDDYGDEPGFISVTPAMKMKCTVNYRHKNVTVQTPHYFKEGAIWLALSLAAGEPWDPDKWLANQVKSLAADKQLGTDKAM